ncbi:MAG: hypothetical protein FWD25_11670 [Clostridia bacterium]|nr:hypothetical protein [Clostridia bacterium]
MMNPATYAMEVFQKEMEDEWEKARIHSQEDLDELVQKMRLEVEAEKT